MRELSYTKNTIFLISAGVFSQIFGAVQKIVLTHYLKEEGMAVYQSAICVYSVFLTLAVSGIPFALTRLISKEGESGRAYAAIGFALKTMCVLGAVLGILMYITRDFFSLAMKESGARYVIAALSPSVFAVAVGAVFKSCFEGHSNMLPCSISQAAESFVKLILAYLFTAFLCVFSVKYAAVGAALALTLGEIFADFVLFLFFIPFLKGIKSAKKCRVSAEILSFALPLALYSLILSSLDLLENSVIRNSLAAISFSESSANRLMREYRAYTAVFDNLCVSKRLTHEGTNWLYGAFFGYAQIVIRFFSGLLRILCVSFFPLAARHFAQNREKAAEAALSKIVRVMLGISVPLCAFLMIFGDRITYILFGSYAYYKMLVFSAPILIFAPLSSLFCTAEYASGKIFAPFLFGAASFFVSIPLCAVLIGIPELNILGAAVATISGLVAELLLHLLFLKKKVKIGTGTVSAFYRAAVCALPASAVAVLIKILLKNCLISTVLAFFVFAAFCGIKKEES